MNIILNLWTSGLLVSIGVCAVLGAFGGYISHLEFGKKAQLKNSIFCGMFSAQIALLLQFNTTAVIIAALFFGLVGKKYVQYINTNWKTIALKILYSVATNAVKALEDKVKNTNKKGDSDDQAEQQEAANQ